MNEATNWIREARKIAGLTTTQLGAAVGVSNASISQIETGRSTPSVPILYRISVALNDNELAEVLAPFVSDSGRTLYSHPVTRKGN